MTTYSGKPKNLDMLEDAVQTLHDEAPFWLQIVIWREGYTWLQSWEHFRPDDEE